MKLNRLVLVTTASCAVSLCACGPAGFQHINPSAKSERQWRAASGQPAQAPTQRYPSSHTSATATAGADPGTPHFINPALRQHRAEFLEDRQRYLADPDAFFSPQATVDCPVSPKFRINIKKSLHGKKLGRRRNQLTSAFYGLKIKVLEGDCADGTLDGPVRYHLHYRERAENKKEQKTLHLEHEVIVSATFENDTPAVVGRRYGRMSKMEVGSGQVPSKEDAGWTRVSFFYAAETAEDAPKVTFAFNEGASNPVETFLRQPRSDGGTVVTKWKGRRQAARQVFDANGNAVNRRGAK